MNKARGFAFQSLVKCEKSGAFANLEAEAILRGEVLSCEDRALYRQLFFGVVEKKITLDYLLSRVCDTPLNKMTPQVLCLLELGVYQILFLDRVPNRAAIFEAGELAKKHCAQSLSLINAVLRRFDREGDEILSYLEMGGKKGLALKHGYPRYLVSLWQDAYGKEKCLDILKAQNHVPPLTLRVNTLKISHEEYEKLLVENGIPFHPNRLTPNGITLEKRENPALLPGFEEGLFFIQDGAAQRAVDRLGAKKGEKILDLCASPGGKSFAAAMDMEGQGEILSFDLHPHRVDLIKKGAERLGIRILKGEVNDSTTLPHELEGQFDRVICDVPCSGFGTIAKKPDIRHKKKEESQGLAPLQYAILCVAARAVKPGGTILYSTCTLNPEENELITEKFLSEHKDFYRKGDYETIFPVGGENDGFFCDCLEKRNG
jgi:16S rRNA (cytosine967-C5)-methyltransferase